ncbi:DUF2066 domain-containing protein [Nitrosococcus wardiae]|uniref:DUF2066 domain-containing protein n=1 Tax=Nitrosococcus wardiae TaxID=1814290 RepID=A0A4P7C3E0_9GAMM|nr:DUF2066 domain-containing protein [Nitrosococcus wardiae]QBQ56319.1 DUF2066 domain-containing protein [Nitrosococcus wardiae]
MKQIVLAIVILGIMPLPVQAIGAVELYEAQVVVSSQSPEEQAEAVKEAFQKVLLKVTGNRHALAEAPLASLLEEASNLVQQFRYNTPEEEKEATTFWVRFDPRGVRQLLRQRGLPMWGRARPTLLLWVAIEDGSQRYLLDASIASPIVETLKAQAESRGIAVLFPLWDLEDQSQLSFTDVWGNFPEPILAASNRYPTSVQLVGRLLRQGVDDWQARWTLYGGAEPGRSWHIEGELEPALRAGIDEAVDVIAARVAPVTGNNSQSSVQVRVTEVTSFMDYARLSSYLSGLSQVIAIQPVQLSRTEAKFRLKLQGGAEALATSIQFGRILAQATEGEATEPGGTNTELNYRLLP